METDRGETADVAAQHHETVSRLSTLYSRWANETGAVDFHTIEDREPPFMKEFRKSKIQEPARAMFSFEDGVWQIKMLTFCQKITVMSKGRIKVNESADIIASRL